MALRHTFLPAVLLLAPVESQAATTVYSAILSGAAEAAPNGSPGTGSAIVTMDSDAYTMRVQVDFAGLIAPVTAAHIHCCTAVAGAATAGVASQTPSFVGFPAGLSGSYDQVFDMTSPLSWNNAFVSGNGGAPTAAFFALLQGLDDGKAYLNIHTSAFPGGEIRGFLLTSTAGVPEPAAWAMMLGGFGLVGFALRRRHAHPVFA